MPPTWRRRWSGGAKASPPLRALLSCARSSIKRARDWIVTLIFGMMQSLDGYVAGKGGLLEMPPPGPMLHRHFNDHVRALAGCLYGRRMYETMRYWDEEQADWDEVERDFARVWRAQPKWVVSRTLKSVGPNASLVGEDVEGFVRRLKAEVEGEIDVAGPELAGALSDLGLVDEYHLYLRPFVLGGGKPFFSGPRPPLRLVETRAVGDDAIKLAFVSG
ncbi:MAG TPA: dihydrofolate reductase family protein [Fimbriimonadaceae bacterium]|nr:dihydrofolate reductase family protein [Fimbriimonadaceae bacterium]